MAEPTATSVGVSLTVISVTVLGPLIGPYALIAFAALAGALWPLSVAPTATRIDGAWLLLRCTLTAVLLTVFLASIIERLWGMPINESLAPVALMIGAMGNGWRPVFGSVADVLRSLLGRLGGGQP